ncbi:MAG: tRNA (N(6)-L-threonylcarbamoyladenosine(37)-C(2))-methylthiotransferase MtaB [Clostridia bacterium]|nr:tRNA (N(6)-L-threonylcarbamoyladenosine(37)-C(2))-methylthiotransferase MtaB [Clostridia bacterium]
MNSFGGEYLNFHFKTLGCKVNQYETQAMKEALIKLGNTARDFAPADAVIVNSCTVTAESDRKTRQLINRVRKDNPDAIIVLTGCMVQAFPEKAKSIKEADIIIGNRDISAVIMAINSYESEKLFNVEEHRQKDAYNCPSITDFSERTRAFMKIEDGCNRYCSYCVIPKARGFVRSRSLESINAEARALAENGYIEIVLVGINLSAYGQGTDYDLCDAVETVCSVSGIKRVRLGSLEPDHITDRMLQRLSVQEKFCPQFHLSLQSGCDETLKRMNRHYDTAFYYDLVSRIRNVFSDASITTDIMVGFAGETDEEFRKSVEFVKKIEFARAHIFAYSRRAGTVADRMPNQVINAIKRERAKSMAIAAKQSETEFLKKQVGKIVPVLFEAEKNGVAEGYTPNYTRVCLNEKIDLKGRIINVRITDAFDDYVTGIPI